MTKNFEIYKCDICGNVVEILFSGAGDLFCCGEVMKKEEEHNYDVGSEKHVPIFEDSNGKTLIKVGEIPHPMLKEHYIKMIEVFGKDLLLRKYLFAEQKPEFLLELNQGYTHARAYCNIHGLWKGENNDI